MRRRRAPHAPVLRHVHPLLLSSSTLASRIPIPPPLHWGVALMCLRFWGFGVLIDARSLAIAQVELRLAAATGVYSTGVYTTGVFYYDRAQCLMPCPARAVCPALPSAVMSFCSAVSTSHLAVSSAFTAAYTSLFSTSHLAVSSAFAAACTSLSGASFVRPAIWPGGAASLYDFRPVYLPDDASTIPLPRWSTFDPRALSVVQPAPCSCLPRSLP
jgi:hypothetical protein